MLRRRYAEHLTQKPLSNIITAFLWLRRKHIMGISAENEEWKSGDPEAD